MSAISTSLRVQGLDPEQLSALKKKAKRLGTSAERYVKKLIADDLALDHLVRTKTLSELSKPLRNAFKNTKEDDIGRLVETVRARHHRRLSK